VGGDEYGVICLFDGWVWLVGCYSILGEWMSRLFGSSGIFTSAIMALRPNMKLQVIATGFTADRLSFGPNIP
jgi:hypothetical protein